VAQSMYQRGRRRGASAFSAVSNLAGRSLPFVVLIVPDDR
jgi:hypothetical protein